MNEEAKVPSCLCDCNLIFKPEIVVVKDAGESTSGSRVYLFDFVVLALVVLVPFSMIEQACVKSRLCVK